MIETKKGESFEKFINCESTLVQKAAQLFILLRFDEVDIKCIDCSTEEPTIQTSTFS